MKFHVNGRAVEVETSPWKRLLDLLREDVGLTGTKEGCGEGECGACTVLIDGEPANSCLVAAGQVAGRQVTTVEGLAQDGALHPVQEALVRLGGTQCGICTPGIAVCAAYVLERERRPSRERIRELLAGNICRCTGYQLIVDAIVAARSCFKTSEEPQLQGGGGTQTSSVLEVRETFGGTADAADGARSGFETASSGETGP